jgi:NADH-quinone oxidoreductase subunit E
MVELECQHCGYKWDYRGDNEYYATCPRCRYKVKLPEDKAREVGRRKLSLELRRNLLTEKQPTKLLGVAGTVNRVIEEFGYGKNMLIQTLLRLQRSFGWLPREMVSEVSKQLRVPLSQVYQIATFYKAFPLAPRGKHLIRVCMGTSCKVRGAPMVLDKIQRTLKIEKDQSTPDGRFSLETTKCAGCCALGPVMTVDSEHYGNLKLPDVERILSKYE